MMLVSRYVIFSIKLTNIKQYECMRGPQNGASVKLNNILSN